ncbi:uncharacterized protein LOC134818277 [Bolinopsis microptera]|uniref:uncharacterized protein LOC134818277 n=1 Tax=Bolinopsis microptera TaxID=2820187 RepID=UPI00307A57B1
MLVFVQGEVIDLYLKEDKKAMILISSFVQFGAVLSSILGTELFVAGRIKKFNVIMTMAIGNAVYYGGAVVAFGATTCDFKFLELTHQLLIGLILMGLGEGFSFNLYTPSKFYLYKKWSVDNSGLGEQSAKIFNIVLNLASAMGTAVSALSLTEKSEIPTIAAISGIGIFLTLGLFLCNLVT